MRSDQRAALLGLSALLLGQMACGTSPEDDTPEDETLEVDASDIDPVPLDSSWAPDPQDIGGMTGIARTEGQRFILYTEDGEVDFLPGVNLGVTTPGHQPGEVALSADAIRRWLPLMGDMGFRVLRIYTILPPHFYTELADYNARNEDAPIYLMQGVYLPDESYVDDGDLFDEGVTTSFSEELEDTVAAVHGDLQRGTTPGRASGEWTADVTPWLAAWIVGSEMEPEALEVSDALNADAPAHEGTYFVSAEGATPTERWLAARMDELATALAERGHASPIAFVNWPTLDPLDHPEEPLEQEDLVNVDANAVTPTAAWPAGTFASYHAYPYYPDFQRHEPELQVEYRGQIDPYAAYLQNLRDHHGDMPTMITEVGVPSSLGSAHDGPLGRDQGGHSEQDAMEINAELLSLIYDLDLAGSLLFAWSDEWFKFTWNTQPRHIPPDRTQLWHDVLTNEQFFGIIATDPTGGDNAEPRQIADESELAVEAATDESWVHLKLEFDETPTQPVTLAFDVLPGGADRLPETGQRSENADYAIVIDPRAGEAQAWVREALDPVLLDGLPGPDPRPGPVNGWVRQQLTLNRALTVPTTGEELPAEFYDIGDLQQGHMDPSHPEYDSQATWLLEDDTLTLRVPWGLLGFGDPSSKQALVPEGDGTADTTTVDTIGLSIQIGDERVNTSGITWSGWQRTYHEERVKAGAQVYVDTQAEVMPVP